VKVYQVVVTAVITSETDPVLGDGLALIQDMVASDTIQVASKVIGEAVDVDDLCEGVIIDGVRFAPVKAP
tara:strand:+ start:103 stop:312 length:210 start_codon:yes stop_codon:yes gene_type:complete